MATFHYSATFARDYKKLTREQKTKFQHEVLTKLAPALDAAPPAFPPGLRVKGVQGRSGVFEMTWDGDDPVPPGRHPRHLHRPLTRPAAERG